MRDHICHSGGPLIKDGGEVRGADETRETQGAGAPRTQYALSRMPALIQARDSRLKAKLFVFLLLCVVASPFSALTARLLGPGGVKVCSFSALRLR